MIAEIRSDGAEPGRNSRRHDAAPDSRPGSFFILAFPSRRQAEPAPNSRRHDAAPDSRQAEPAPDSRTHLLRVETERSRAGRLPLAALVFATRSFRHPFLRVGLVRGQTACLAVPGVCLLRGGRSAPRPGSLCGAGSPCGPQCRRSALHPGDFLPDEKVTKESPRGGPPLGTPPRGTLRSPCGKPQPPR